MQVIVEGLLTNYAESGKGKNIVFLHGWGDSSNTFKSLFEIMPTGFHLLAPDLPGFGGSQAPPKAWGLEDYANFVANWLKKIKVHEVNAVVGHSFGGAVAIVGAANGSLKTEKLVLIATSGIRGERSLKGEVLWLGAKILKVPLYLMPARRAEKIKTKLYKKAGSDLWLMPSMRETFLKTIKQDVRLAAAKVNSPTLLIYGARDKETPPRYGQLIREIIKDSRLELIEGAGHFIHQQQPGQVAGYIKQFLEVGKAT